MKDKFYLLGQSSLGSHVSLTGRMGWSKLLKVVQSQMYKEYSNLLIVSEVQSQTSFWEIHAVKFNWKYPKTASQYYSTALTITWYLGLQEWDFSWCSPPFPMQFVKTGLPGKHFLILQHFNAMSRWPQGIWGTSATAGLFQCNFGNRKFAKLLCIGGVSSCNLDFLLPGTSIEELGKGWPVPVTQIGSTVPQRIHVLARDNAVDCWRMHSMLHELYP